MVPRRTTGQSSREPRNEEFVASHGVIIVMMRDNEGECFGFESVRIKWLVSEMLRAVVWGHGCVLQVCLLSFFFGLAYIYFRDGCQQGLVEPNIAKADQGGLFSLHESLRQAKRFGTNKRCCVSVGRTRRI